MSLDKLKQRISQTQHTTYTLEAKVKCPITVFDLSADIDNQKLIEDIYKFKSEYPVSMHHYLPEKTNIKAWHSDYGTQNITHILDELLSVQTKKIKDFLVNADVTVKSVWINIYERGDSAKRHMHTLFGWSTVYYPYVEDKSTALVFDNNDPLKKENLSIVPKTGMFLLFPSYLYHNVPAIKENKRISIASNINIIENVAGATEAFKINYNYEN